MTIGCAQQLNSWTIYRQRVTVSFDGGASGRRLRMPEPLLSLVGTSFHRTCRPPTAEGVRALAARSLPLAGNR
jgi:hypothetical protein